VVAGVRVGALFFGRSPVRHNRWPTH
jgi:hypothetical protein